MPTASPPLDSPEAFQKWLLTHIDGVIYNARVRPIYDAFRALAEDRERLDWLESTRHVICYDDGEWFCAWRVDGTHWEDRPMAGTVRAAIEAARTASRSEGCE